MALIVSDLVTLGAGFRIAYWIRFELGLPIFRLEFPPTIGFYQLVVLVLAPVWLIIFALNGLYQEENLLGGPSEYSRVFRGTTIGLLVVTVAGFLEPELVVARGWLLLAWLLTACAVSIGRFLLRRMIYYLRRNGHFLAPALIVGAQAEGQSLAQQLRTWSTSGLRIVGFVDDGPAAGTRILGDLPILGAMSDLDDVIERHRIKELIISTSSLTRREMLSIFERYGFSENVNLRLSSGLFEIITTGLNVKEFAYVPLVGVNKVRLTGTDRILKAAMDLTLASLALIVAVPFLVLIAIAIKLDSPGALIYRRRVMGVNGKVFDAFKFRTMHVNGEKILDDLPHLREELIENFKLREDPRVTRVGAWLRKLSLDELPQLVNVLRREMSLVGPRMISPEEMEKYEPWGLNLLTVHPGITGIWQVSGRSNVSYEERVRMDMHYIRNWTIWMDLQLLFQTIPAVLRGTGAY
jgi:exopolysaccharide biosynthesis polyprenyl glycosylphosphotransferase